MFCLLLVVTECISFICKTFSASQVLWFNSDAEQRQPPLSRAPVNKMAVNYHEGETDSSRFRVWWNSSSLRNLFVPHIGSAWRARHNNNNNNNKMLNQCCFLAFLVFFGLLGPAGLALVLEFSGGLRVFSYRVLASPWKSLNLCLKVLESAWIWFSKTPWPNQLILKKVFHMASFWPQICIKSIFDPSFAPDTLRELTTLLYACKSAGLI